MFSLFFGSRSSKFNYTTKYNGMTFYIRLKQLFRKLRYKEGQVINYPNGEAIRLTKFIRYNNCYDECWEFEFVDYPSLGKSEKWM